MVTALLVGFLSSVTWLWDEFVNIPRPPVVQWLARLHWYGVVIVGLCIFIFIIGEAAYQAIRKTEGLLESMNAAVSKYYDGRPQLSLESLRYSSNQWITANHAFSVQNIGARAARDVSFRPIQQGDWTLQLNPMGTLVPMGQKVPVGFKVSNYLGAMEQRVFSLRLFFEAAAEHAKSKALAMPISAEFIDQDGEVREERFLLECSMPDMAMRVRPVPNMS